MSFALYIFILWCNESLDAENARLCNCSTCTSLPATLDMSSVYCFCSDCLQVPSPSWVLPCWSSSRFVFVSAGECLDRRCYHWRCYRSHSLTFQALLVEWACHRSSESVPSVTGLVQHVHFNSPFHIVTVLGQVKICHRSTRNGSLENTLLAIILPQSVWKLHDDLFIWRRHTVFNFINEKY